MDATESQNAKSKDLEVVDLIELVEPGVVRIDVVFGDDRGIGSGFVVSTDGIVVTNYHVVHDADTAADTATVSFRDGRTVPVLGVLFADRARDLAIIKIPSRSENHTVQLCQTASRKGERVVAFGAPEGLSFSATEGIVSGIRRGSELSQFGTERPGTWVQTSAAISRGNSGGPLINLRGEAVGMNTFSLLDAQNLNFAISAADIRETLEKAAERPLLALGAIGDLSGSELLSADHFRRVQAAEAILAFDISLVREISKDAVPSILRFIQLEIAELLAPPDKCEESVQNVTLPADPSDVSLLRIKADPAAYLDQTGGLRNEGTFTIVGRVSTSSSFYSGYRDAEATDFVFDFAEVNLSGEPTGESAHLYAWVPLDGPLVDRVATIQEWGFGGALIRARVRLDPKRYQGADSWNLMNLADWQLFDREKSQWKPWGLAAYLLGHTFVARVRDVDALVAIITTDELAWDFADYRVRSTAMGTLTEIPESPDMTRTLVELIAWKMSLGSETTNSSLRDDAAHGLARFSSRERRRASSMLQKELGRARKDRDAQRHFWISEALHTLEVFGGRL